MQMYVKMDIICNNYTEHFFHIFVVYNYIILAIIPYKIIVIPKGIIVNY